MKQFPEGDKHILKFRGDVIKFSLNLNSPMKGKAYLRTNLENSEQNKQEIIAHIENERPIYGLGWRDIPMLKIDDCNYEITLALTDVGHFEAKCLFLEEGKIDAEWSHGGNTNVNVEPTEYCCANTIYCAFVRQFGPNKTAAFTDDKDMQLAGSYALDRKGYTIIPSSGTFRDLIGELDHIIDGLNCRIIHLLPINPTPTTYARMGRFGSPYAATDFTAIDPALAEFDTKATPLEQFYELADRIHLKDAKLFIDIAINHTGWAAKIHEEHPEWLVRKDDGHIVSPGAWGNIWADLTELDHSKKDLWQYLADMFLVWCDRGVDGFRCDAGYMIPIPAWEYIISKVKEQYPNIIFLLEGLGGDPQITVDLLNKANMNWAYSELFQNYSKEAINGYIPHAEDISKADGLMVHYAETHDNSRLAEKSTTYAKMRTLLSAFTSSNGTFGFTNGVEWFAAEKIDVHESRGLNWGNKENQIKEISRVNSLMISHPSFYDGARTEFIDAHTFHSDFSNDVTAFKKISADGKNEILVLVNLNCELSNKILWNSEIYNAKGNHFIDLMNDKKIDLNKNSKNEYSITLKAGEVVCLTNDKNDIIRLNIADDANILKPNYLMIKRAKAMALDLLTAKRNSKIILKNFDDIGVKFLESPVDFCKELYQNASMVPITNYNCPQDLNREVMLPPNNILFVKAENRFRIRIIKNGKVVIQKDSLIDNNGQHFAMLPAMKVPKEHEYRDVKLTSYGDDKLSRREGRILLLSKGDSEVSQSLSSCDIRTKRPKFMATNSRGGMCHIPVEWGQVYSKYDAIIAANLSKEIPVDRHIMWTRCRAWIKVHSGTKELSLDVTKEFKKLADGSGSWDFSVPINNAITIDLTINLAIAKNANSVKMTIQRNKNSESKFKGRDNIVATLIIRPDIEDRSFHAETSISEDLQNQWNGKIKTVKNGFDFNPCGERAFSLHSNKGFFMQNAETAHKVFHGKEAHRGLEAYSDLFSPGYFTISLIAGEKVQLIGAVTTPDDKEKEFEFDNKMPENITSSFEDIMLKGMDQFVVKRDELKTVIAGYPWFTDWGRDTLICARGLISAGKEKDVGDIILAFAKYAKDGILPNIIHGSTVGNWDTSDAPLWLLNATNDYCDKFSDKILKTAVPDKKKTLLEVLESIAEGYIKGTPNGIKMDKDSSLIYSPSHFTWMDTNYPAGTPRSGYPIEIQSLWFGALSFLFAKTADKKWEKLATKVKKSVMKYFVRDDIGLSDCLHVNHFDSAKNAIADDAIRNNQLFAITLGLIDDHDLRVKILNATESLLIPGGIRSLADRRVNFALTVRGMEGQILNDPENPYWGYYAGDEDTRRKPAYHNGTAWSWTFPAYSEAYLITYGGGGKKNAKAILSSSKIQLEQGCIGQIAEIFDGNAPHYERGCDAQAWGITELYRVWQQVK